MEKSDSSPGLEEWSVEFFGAKFVLGSMSELFLAAIFVGVSFLVFYFSFKLLFFFFGRDLRESKIWPVCFIFFIVISVSLGGFIKMILF